MWKLISNYLNAWNGFKAALCTQWAFRVEMIVFFLSIPGAIILGNSATEYAMLISSIVIILMVELLNSAVETVIDRISLDYHELSGIAKDLASAATLFACLNALFIWAMILFARLA